MSEKKIFSLKVVVACCIGIIILICIALISNAIEDMGKTRYDKARERIVFNNGSPEPEVNNGAFNLFRFNTGQINSGEVIFPGGLAKEFADKHNDHFYNPVELLMEYQGHDWDGELDDNHSLVFEDGSTVVAEIHNGALHLRYYDGWIMKGKNTFLSRDMLELWITKEGKKLWRNDGKAFSFDCYDVSSDKEDLLGTWIFWEDKAYNVTPNEETLIYDAPFNFNRVSRWCGLKSDVYAFTVHHDGCTELWKFAGGAYEMISFVDWDVDIVADNFGSAHSDKFIRFTLPKEVVTIAQNGSVTRETITAKE